MSELRPPSRDRSSSFVNYLGSEVNYWMAGAPRGQREDVSSEVWAFALATYVDGIPITPRGYDVSDELEGGVEL